MAQKSENTGGGQSLTAAYVRASRERAIAAGARMIPRGLLHRPAAEALEALRANGYADSLTGCIERALEDAARTLAPKPAHAKARKPNKRSKT